MINWLLKKKKIIILIIILCLVGVYFFRSNGKIEFESEVISKKDLKKVVLGSGIVVSGVDLNLSFKTSGLIKSLPVKVGQKVVAGQVIAELDNRSEKAAVLQASGSVASAQASLQKVLDGSSSQEVLVAKSAVDAAYTTLNNAKYAYDNTKVQQDVLVANAKKALVSSSLEAFPSGSNQSSTPPTITGSYTGSVEGAYIVRQEGDGFTVSGLENIGHQSFSRSLPLPMALGSKGLYIQFNTTNTSSGDTWIVSIPNKRSSSYVVNLNAYNQAVEVRSSAILSADNAVKSAQSAYDQAVAALEKVKSQARPAEVASARAQIVSAQGSLASAQALLENTILRAPVDGVITTVDIKLAEQATALKSIIRLQNLDKLHIESNISESIITQIKQGQKAMYTFDSFGKGRVFDGAVELVDPASKIISGIVNYKVTTSINDFKDLKSGMTANVVIEIDKKDQVLAIPEKAVQEKDGKTTVSVVSDKVKGVFVERSVVLGLKDSSGYVEVISGLTEGEEVVTLKK